MKEFFDNIKKKDKQAVQLIYNRYGKKLYGYAVLKWKLDEDEAWDLIYATLYKTINVIDRYTFESESKFVGFLFTAFTNNLRNHYNKKKQQEVQIVELKDEHGNVSGKESEQVKESAHMKCLQQGLSEMEDWKRIVLLMRAQEHSYEEIAAYVQKPVEQLKVYYMRLKKILIQKINDCLNKAGK